MSETFVTVLFLFLSLFLLMLVDSSILVHDRSGPLFKYCISKL